MAAERPSILSVKNDILRVALPFLEGTPHTYLTASLDAAGTTLTVRDNIPFAQNDYLVLELPGHERAEIVRITAAVTAGTSLTVTAATFPHGVGTKVTLIRYNQVNIYQSASGTDTNPTQIGSSANLDVGTGYNELVATTTNDFYYARYVNAQTGATSVLSDAAAAGGYSARARGEIKQEFLSMYNEVVNDLVSDDWLNRAINRWQRSLSKRRKQWSVLRSLSTQNTVQDQQGYALPATIQDNDSRDSIVSVKIADDFPLEYIDQEVFLQLTSSFIGDTLSSAASIGNTTITLTDSSDFPASGTVHIEGDSITYTANAEATGVLSGLPTSGAITAFADAGGGAVTVTSAGHGLSNGNTVTITGTTSYNGTFVIAGVAVNTFEITDTFVADDATGAWSLDSVGGGVGATHAAAAEVWNFYITGKPLYFTIDDGTLLLHPIPNADSATKNLNITFWRRFPDLSDDSDETLFLYPENCYLYMNWQLSIRKKLPVQEQTLRKSEWEEDLESLVSEDPDFRDVRIEPHNLYKRSY